MTYAEKLKDPRWQRKRLEIFQRDNFTCVASGISDLPLCVHHMRYHGQPWQTPDAELETLCMDIHSLIEPFARALRGMYPEVAFSGRDIWTVLLLTDEERLRRGEPSVGDEPAFWKVSLEVVCRTADFYGVTESSRKNGDGK